MVGKEQDNTQRVEADATESISHITAEEYARILAGLKEWYAHGVEQKVRDERTLDEFILQMMQRIIFQRLNSHLVEDEFDERIALGFAKRAQ